MVSDMNGKGRNENHTYIHTYPSWCIRNPPDECLIDRKNFNRLARSITSRLKWGIGIWNAASVHRVYEVGYKEDPPLVTKAGPSFSPYMRLMCQYPKVLIQQHKLEQREEPEVHARPQITTTP